MAVLVVNWPTIGYNWPYKSYYGRKMTDNTKKMAVLQALQQQKKAVSSRELLKILGSEYKERSVRRWLDDLCKAGQVVRAGKKRGTQYQADIPALPTQNVFELFRKESTAKIQFVRQPLINRKPVGYHESLVKDYRPNHTYYLDASSRKKLFQSGNKNIDAAPAGTYARKIYNTLLIDLSYNSSRLEGNTYTRLDTEKLILEGIDPEGKLDEEKIMILNHKEAIRHLVESGNQIRIDSDEIHTLHYLLADGLVPPHYAGKIRDHGVRIGASSYIPLDNIQKIKKNLALICQKANVIEDPFEQSFFLLVHLAYLQAFTDVNKRTSRLSANIPLIRGNFVPLSFNDVDKDDYILALLVFYELHSTEALEDIYCNSYLRTCEQYQVLTISLGVDELRVRYRQQRREIVAHIIRHQLIAKQQSQYIKSALTQLIPENDRAAVKKIILEDLTEINSARIVGMGISNVELQQWLSRYNKRL